VELLMVRPRDGAVWEALVRPGRRLKPGTVVEVGAQRIPLEVGERIGHGRRLVRLVSDGSMFDLLREAGEMPVPPYIRRPIDDPAHYQTVYARADGSIAAPTAGLHFTADLLDRLRQQGVAIVSLTLHVGAGTFQPVVTEDVHRHHLEAEHYTIPADAAEAINRRKGRLVAVGTTTVRALESAVAPDGRVLATSGWTDLFIVPGFQFRAVEALVTNFHLPRSTLLMLVSAFAGRERILSAYAEAVRARYRFYSFGDAMLIL
jgi:S-adenosylmethionine:tRNA ribosyltransferase-isomerase